MTKEQFRKKCETVGSKVGIEPMFFEYEKNDEHEDDGNLHISRCGINACFGFGQDTPGKRANEMIRTIMTALGLKRKIGKRVLVTEECEECDGDGEVQCGACNEYHCCDVCDGKGFTEPEDYK